ncbi:hypothetical protein HOU00_gp046 [Caulobacter phage CcrPW]|uniref:Uncharacterized protein n=1 Tax=Caulobacter phage CcrPW TaxID=2283271 RepID=A0A385EC54_9CAUD|nr:hypothetical protein HOU00_gp046 [Caulobacter phage CcrPW]AXQ68585.1 hypothetical protein CcrPW_gp046 [Caulobacter phage CcrPW]
MSFSTEENDRAFVRGGAGGVAYSGGGSAYAQGGAGGTAYVGGGPSIDAQLAQQRIDNLRAIALRQAVDAQASKFERDGESLDADLIIRSARQFYAFLSGDTPTSEG